MSGAAKIHSKHVKGEGIDCGNCHTFSSGGLVKRGESDEDDEGDKSENITQNQNVTSERSGEHSDDGNKNEKREGKKSDHDD
jgi:hypothetical protein